MGETIITGLLPNTDYQFQVIPINSRHIAGPPHVPVGYHTPDDTYAPSLPTIIDTGVVGRLLHVVVDNVVAADFAGFEFHASLSAGFTPSDSTLVQKGNSTTCEFKGTADAQTWYVRVCSYDTTGNKSNYCAQSSIATATYNPDDTTAPATPTGLSLATGVAADADGKQIVYIDANWTANTEGDLSGYEVQYRQGTSGNYSYFAVPVNGVRIAGFIGNVAYYVAVRAYDRNANASAFCSAETITSAKDITGPGVPTSFAAAAFLGTINLTWANPTDKDLSHINIYRGSTATRGSAALVAKTKGTAYTDFIGSYGATRYYWIAAEDASGNVSATEAGPVNATTATVAVTDISAFAVTASKIWNKIPVLESDSWTNNSPSAGYVAWSAHYLYYNGVQYSIAAGNTNLKYICWLSGYGTYSASNTNPALSDGDFAIATNISGVHDLAWNAIANEIIGAAYIENLAVTDAKIESLTVGKLTAGEIAVNQNIRGGQTAYNTGTGFFLGMTAGGLPQFSIGDATSYLTYASGVLNVKGAITATSGYLQTLTLGKTGVASGTLTLQLYDGNGDTYIAAGKTDFTTTTAGFILGLDDSDANKAKLYIGDTSNYLYWDGTNLSIQGAITGSYLYGSAWMTKGTYLTTSCGAGDATLYVGNTTDFPNSGAASFIDLANDRDVFTYTGKTATTLTGCSGVLVHTVSTSNRPLVVPPVKGMYISDAANEMRFIGDRGDGVFDELGSIGTSSDTDTMIAKFGNTAYSTRIGVTGFSHTFYGVYGWSVDNIGVKGVNFGASAIAGVYGESTNGPGVSGYSYNSYGLKGESNTTYAVYSAGTTYLGGNTDIVSTKYLGLGSAAGRITFTDAATDTISFLSCHTQFSGGGVTVGDSGTDPGLHNLLVDGTLHVDGVATLDGGCSLGAETVGTWTTPAFDAANFTANSSTWTVAAGDVITYAYTIVNKIMTVSFNIVTAAVGGTPSMLRIAIPASKTATKQMTNCCRITDNSVYSAGFVQVTAGGTLLNISRIDFSSWSTADASVAGQITFEIN